MNVTEFFRGNIYNASDHGGIADLNASSNLNKIISVLIIVILFITMVSLGCSMEVYKIKAHFFKPKGVAIALLAQFGIMPLTAFCLAKIQQMDPIKAVTVLLCGCCPGGSLSNIFSLALQGDLNLSIVMTTCSSFAALVLMPLLLYIYCRGFPGLEKAVPFADIMKALSLSLGACAIGIALNHYKPSYAAVIRKVGLSILVISSIILAILSSIAIKDTLWMALTAEIVRTAALMPLIGFMLGYGMSAICKMNSRCCRTISMEIGCQNIQLCFAILKVAFPPEAIGPMFLFPLIYMTFQCIEALLLALCFRCYQTIFKTPAEDTGKQDTAAIKQGGEITAASAEQMTKLCWRQEEELNATY